MLNPPMVGRDDALRKVTGFLDDALGGQGNMIFISGEAGIGKTRLAEELEEIARKKGFQVMVGRCIPGTPTPYLPFQDAFGSISQVSLQKDSKPRGIKDLVKVDQDQLETGIVKWLRGPSAGDIGMKPDGLQGVRIMKDNAFEAVIKGIIGLSKAQPILFVLEDLHWADSATVQIMHFLARNLGGLMVLMVGTYRTEEVEGKGTGEVHPLMESLRVMKREGICQELSLMPLSQEDTSMAIEGILGGPLDIEILEQIAKDSGGNPLFATEMARLLVENHSITEEHGIWIAKKGAHLVLPTTVMEVALRRLERLLPEERRLLECAAVEGEYFHVHTIQEVLGLEKLNILESLDSLENDHLLVQPFRDDFKFNHEIICKVTYDHISKPRRRELHRLIGISLEKAGTGPSNYSAISLHFFNAGEEEKCSEYSLLAGKVCLWQRSVLEAINFFQRALDCCSKSESYQERRLQAMEGLADAYASDELMRCGEALPNYEKCLGETKDPKVKARILRKMGSCYTPEGLGMGDATKAWELFKEAEACESLDPGERAEIFNAKTHIAIMECRWDEAEVYSEEARRLFEEVGADEKVAELLAVHTDVDLSRGHVSEALEKLGKVKAINQRCKSSGVERIFLLESALAHMHWGRYREALCFLDDYYKLIEKKGAPIQEVTIRFYKTLIYDIIADYEAEMDNAVRCAQVAEIGELDYDRLAATALIIKSSLRLNKVEEAQKKEGEMSELLKKFDPRLRTLTRSVAEIAQAELCFSRGEMEEGDKRFQDGIAMIHGTLFGIFFEGVARTWYGEYLAKQWRQNEARLQYSQAIGLFEKLENRIEVEKAREKLSNIS